MNTPRDPLRTLQAGPSVPEELRSALEAGCADGPGAADMEALAQRLAFLLTPGPCGSAPSALGSGAIGPAGLALTKGKAILAAVAIATALPATWYGWSRWSSHFRAEHPAAKAVAESRPVAVPADRASPKPTAAMATPDPDRATLEPVLKNRPASTGLTASARPPGNSVAPEAAKTDAGAELRLIQQARGQLARAAYQALQLTERHRREYPEGVFAQEREAIAIEALVKIGEIKKAKQRAEAFETLYPGSVYTRHIRLLSGGF